VIDGDGLGETAVVAAGVGCRVSALDNEFVGAGTRRALIAVGDHWSRTATIGRNYRGIVGGGDGAGAFHGEGSREACDDRGVGVIDGDGLGGAAAVATGVGSSVGAFDHVLIDASSGRGLITVSNNRGSTTIIGCHYGGVIRCRD